VVRTGTPRRLGRHRLSRLTFFDGSRQELAVKSLAMSGTSPSGTTLEIGSDRTFNINGHTSDEQSFDGRILLRAIHEHGSPKLPSGLKAAPHRLHPDPRRTSCATPVSASNEARLLEPVRGRPDLGSRHRSPHGRRLSTARLTPPEMTPRIELPSPSHPVRERETMGNDGYQGDTNAQLRATSIALTCTFASDS
jgi:hypothetical protein